MNPAWAKTPGEPGLLLRLLDEPQTLQIIQSLDAQTLGKLIRHIGLEDAGEIIALATRDQLLEVFDDDLWRSEQPGREETFDAERFGLWLEVMLEMGAKTAAQKLAEMDYNFITLAFTHHLLVLNADKMRLHFPGDDPDDDLLVDKALESSPNYEFGPYVVIARNDDSWNALLAILSELDAGWHDFLYRILDTCSRMSAEYIEDHGGLVRVLSDTERLRSDVAEQREQRREKRGFVSSSDAAHFLNLARAAGPDECLRATAPDAVTHAYFRSFTGAGQPAAAFKSQAPKSSPLISFLAQNGLLPASQPVPLPPAPDSGAAGGAGLMREGLADLKARDEELYSRRLLELNYLANVLMTGCEYQNRRFRPVEAAQAALAVANLGLEYCLSQETAAANRRPHAGATADLLSAHDAVKLFRTGWSILYREVSLRAWNRLAETLTVLLQSPEKPKGQSWTERQLAEWLTELARQLAAGSPWAARDKLDLLEFLFDAPTSRTLKALLAECPSLPADLNQPALPGFEFICCRRQIDQAQTFLQALKAGL